MMPYTFHKATLSPTNLVIGLSGPTGKGKTYTALRLAKGLARGGKVIAGDTEKGRITRYANEFDFDVCQILPPYRPKSYIDFLEAAFLQKPAVVILDSTTHEWVSEGGCLEWHDKICKEMSAKWGGSPEKYNFQAWGEPKQEHWKFISKLEAPPCHIICTFRAKEKFEQSKDQKGKTVIRSRGMCPDGSEDLPYTMDFIAMLDGEEPGVPSFNYKPLTHTLADILKPGERLTERHGELLAQWGEGKKTGFPSQGAREEVPANQSDLQGSEPGKETGAKVGDPLTTNQDIYEWIGSDGTVKEITGSGTLLSSVTFGVGKATDQVWLEKCLAVNVKTLMKLKKDGQEDIAEQIKRTVETKALRLRGVMPPV